MERRVHISGIERKESHTFRRVLFPSLRRFLRSPVVSLDVWRQLKDYNRPDFHPDDSDTNDLVEQWRKDAE